MTTKHLIITILLALVLPLLNGCKDNEIDNKGVTDTKIEEIEGYKLSSFSSDRLQWNLTGSDENLRTILHSHTDNQLYEFDLKISHDAGKPIYTLYIPDKRPIPDGEYDAIAVNSAGATFGPRTYFKFSKMLVETIAARDGKFRLKGRGTEENPYIISSKSDFEEFEIGLFEDGNSNGFGLFFEQTASFDVPPRSQIIMGTYHACESFAGNYNGNGYTINVPYTGSATEGNDSNIGLFKELLGGATIRNLNINALMQGIYSNGGALAGKASGTVTISKVNVEGSVNSRNLTNIGGFIGYATGNITITDCNLTAFVQGENAVGGIIGNFSNGTLTIDNFSNCKTETDKIGNIKRYYSPFSVTATAENAGGLVGKIDDNSVLNINDIDLMHSVQAEDGSVKAVSAEGSNAGSLFGLLNSSGLCNLMNITVNAPIYGGNNAGGLIGFANLASDMTFEKCTFHSVAGGNDMIGGFFGCLKGNGHSLNFNGNDNSCAVKQAENSLVKISGTSSVGGFAGFAENVVIKGSKFYINTGVSASAKNAGGVCGAINSMNFQADRFNLSNSMHIAGPENIGGLFGSATYSDISGTIKMSDLMNYDMIPAASAFESAFAGTVGNASNATAVGGIVGFSENTRIKKICFTGTVVGSSCVGGIVGLMRDIESGGLSDCINNSQKITNKISDYTGGIAGCIQISRCDAFDNLINYAEIDGSGYTGGIFGSVEYVSCKSNFNLTNAVNTGKITGIGQVGGCVGNLYADPRYAVYHNIHFAANYGDVSNSGGGNVGGIIGYFNTTYSVVMYSANHGNIKGSGNDVMVGGVAGRMGTNEISGVIVDRNMELAFSCNFGEVSSDTEKAHVGGLLGWQEQGSSNDETHYMLHDCYNMGAIPSDQKEDNGGILGCIDHYGEVQNCINVGKVSHGNGCIGTHKDGCIFYHHNLYYLKDSGKGWCADEFKESDKSNTSTFKNFDFKSVWIIDTENKNKGFPYLKTCPFQFKPLS